jgi:aldehyde:ferredoxin oxidoreductase
MALSAVNGKILHVNLTEGKTWVETPSEEFYRKFGGGSAMGLSYILREVPPKIDAFSPENVITFFVGVPTGLPISGQSRMVVTTKSPLTNAIADSQCGGFFPTEMKFAGFDGIVVRGKSPKPVYLWIHDGEVEIRDASHLWGKTTGEVEDIIREELGDKKVEIAQIGPAGEKLVRIASIMNMVNRANGRTGVGAVMGSKNLKAVVVRGSPNRVKAARPQELTRLFRDGTKRIPDTPAVQFLHEHGTTGDVAGCQAVGQLPTRNFNEGQFEGYESIAGELMTETILVERDTCYSCTVRCKRVVETEFLNQKVLPRFGGPEYETMAAFGSYCAVDNMHAVALANQLCNQYGMDTISCGATIAFAMECFENGLLTLEDTGGLDLHFGNAEAMVKLVEMIGKREGFGNVLAEGTERAAKVIGKNAADFLITAKGQEMPAHMPQFKRSLGLIYAVNPFGADHMSSEHDPFIEEGNADEMAVRNMAQLGLTELQPPGSITAEKVRMAYTTQKVFSALDSFALCMFVYGVGWQLYSPLETVEMINLATGWDMTLDEFMQVGERRINMMRVFNAREGFTREQDNLTKKFFTPLKGTGPTAGVYYKPEEFEFMKDTYYKLAEWDMTTGNPTPAKLLALGLDWLPECKAS